MIENVLTEKFEKEIFDKNLDLSLDYMEVALDAIIKDELLKEIPIVKTLVSFYNISSSIVARHNVKKIIVFLQEFQSQNTSIEKLEAFKEKLDSNNNFKNEVLETILILIEKFIDVEKSKILANLFVAYIEKNLTWNEFKELTFILNNLPPSGYTFLEKFINKKYSLRELNHGEATIIACGIGYKFEEQLKLTRVGFQLYEFGIKPIKIKHCT